MGLKFYNCYRGGGVGVGTESCQLDQYYTVQFLSSVVINIRTQAEHCRYIGWLDTAFSPIYTLSLYRLYVIYIKMQYQNWSTCFEQAVFDTSIHHLKYGPQLVLPFLYTDATGYAIIHCMISTLKLNAQYSSQHCISSNR